MIQGGIPVTASITSGQVGADLQNEIRNTNNVNGRVAFNNLIITGPPDDDYVLTFTATVGGLPLIPVSSSPLTVVAGTASRIVILTQPSATAINAAVFAQQPVVQVQDAGGNPVPTAGLVIAASIQDGQGALGPTPVVNATTDGTGTATFAGLRITGVSGNRTLSFSRPGLTGVESNQINVTAGPPASLAIQAGDNQIAPVGTAVPTEPSVIVTDVSGNPVSGVGVTFEVTGGGGSVSPETAVATGSNGIASVTSWTLGAAAGANTLVASVPSAPGLGTETFNATGTATNQPPTAQADAYSVDEDQTLTVIEANGVLDNDTDPDAGDDLTADLVTGPSNAQNFALNSDGSFTYTPSADFNGSDSFTYQANDGEVNSNTVTVTITVNPVNDDPGFSAGPAVEVSSLGSALGFTDEAWATGISPGPTDESGQTVAFQVSTDNPDAFVVPPAVDAAGTLTFTPTLTLVQVTVTATITAEDSGGGTSAPQTFSITINL